MTRGLTLYLVEKTLSLGQLSSWVAAATEAGCLASSAEGGLLELQTNHCIGEVFEISEEAPTWALVQST